MKKQICDLFFYPARMSICAGSASVPTTQRALGRSKRCLWGSQPASGSLSPRAPWWIMNPWLVSQEVNPTGVWKLLCFPVTWTVCPGLFIWITYYTLFLNQNQTWEGSFRVTSRGEPSGCSRPGSTCKPPLKWCEYRLFHDNLSPAKWLKMYERKLLQWLRL